MHGKGTPSVVPSAHETALAHVTGELGELLAVASLIFVCSISVSDARAAHRLSYLATRVEAHARAGIRLLEQHRPRRRRDGAD